MIYVPKDFQKSKPFEWWTLPVGLVVAILLSIGDAKAGESRTKDGLQYGLYGESDTTLISVQVYRYKKTKQEVWCRYFFDSKDYEDAAQTIQHNLHGGIDHLNLMAQKEYINGLSTIKDMKCGESAIAIKYGSGE